VKGISLYFFHASGPENLLRFEASDCSAQRDFKGEKWQSHFSPLKSLEGQVGDLPKERLILSRIL
jgi:hypothetical protein